MEIKKLFDQYYAEFRDKERIWSWLSVDEKEEQFLFDLRGYCMTQRVFLEEYRDDPKGKKAALQLFPFPVEHPAFRERLKKEVLTQEWYEIWLDHRRSIKELFDTDEESRSVFLWSLIREADDFQAWKSTKIAPEGFHPGLVSLIRSCAEGFRTADQLMAELRKDGFAPETLIYQREEKMIRSLIQPRV